MYTKKEVEEALSQVEQELNKALGSVTKSEITEEVAQEEVAEIEVQEEEMVKSEESEIEVEESEEDYQTIDELYGSMNKNELESHYNSVKKALFGEESEMEKSTSVKRDKRSDAEGDTAMDEFHAQAKKDSDYEDLSEHGKQQRAKEYQKKASMAAFGKSEESEVESLVKSENEVLKEENESLKKSLDEINELIEKMFNKKAPSQKAITGTTYVAKSEESNEEEVSIEGMSKSEITSKLKSIDYSSLSKSDRENINEYYLNNGSVSKIKHLIKE